MSIGDVPTPAFGGVEQNNADRTLVVTGNNFAERLAVSALIAGLAPSAPERAKVIKHEIGFFVGSGAHKRD